MAFKIIWSESAIDDYSKVINYLLESFPLFVAENFIQITETRIFNLTAFPEMGKLSKKINGARSIVLTKHNKLYYSMSNDTIEILNIFDTRQNPEKNSYE
jgi:plasmid stabilization system protein ParE